jgi:Lrp/AsnC family transcriptional regulator
VDGNDRAQAGGLVVTEDHQFVTVEFPAVEGAHSGAPQGWKRRSVRPASRNARYKTCLDGRFGEISIPLVRQFTVCAMHVELDRGDLRILDVLQHHANLSAAEIAEKVDMTPSTCWRRITRLEEQGVIKSRVTLLDREKVGLNVTVFSRVKLAAHGRDSLGRFEAAVREHPEVLECYTLMGDTDFLLRIVVRDIKAYEAFFLDHLSKMPGVESVHSSIALSTIKETTALPLSRR